MKIDPLPKRTAEEVGLAVPAKHDAPKETCIAETCGCAPGIAKATEGNQKDLARRAQCGEGEVRDNNGLGRRGVPTAGAPAQCAQSKVMSSIKWCT